MQHVPCLNAALIGSERSSESHISTKSSVGLNLLKFLMSSDRFFTITRPQYPSSYFILVPHINGQGKGRTERALAFYHSNRTYKARPQAY